MLITLFYASAVYSQEISNCNASKFRVAIDIGHTPNQPGAISARGGKEYDFNRKLALSLILKLRKEGFSSAFVINLEGREISLRTRTVIAETHGADIIISIHHDSVQRQFFKSWYFQGQERHFTDHARGFSVFISKGRSQTYDISQKVAESIARNLISAGIRPTHHHAEAIRGENRELIEPKLGIYNYPQLAILRTADSPALLFEAGVITNRKEEVLLLTPSYVEQLISALIIGITTACSLK